MQANFYDGAIVGQREEQQDDRTNLILKDGYRLYVLADGMGGHNAGNIASKLVCSAFRDFFSALEAIEEPERVLKEALHHANESMQTRLQENADLHGMGTTVIAVLLHEPTGQYSFISVADSPLYKYTHEGLMRINQNHAFYEDLKRLVHAGEMTQEEADSHPDRHAITSAVMGRAIEKFDVQSGQFSSGELLILASDGVQTLSESTDGEIAQVIAAANADPEQTVQQLLKAVEDKGISHQDNTTLIVVRSDAEEGDDTTTNNKSSQKRETAPSTPKTQVEMPQKKVNKPSAKKRGKWWLWLLVIIAAGAALWATNPTVQGHVSDILDTVSNQLKSSD